MVPLLPLYFHCDLIFFDYISHMFFGKLQEEEEVLFCCSLVDDKVWCVHAACFPVVWPMGYDNACWLVWSFGSIRMIPRPLLRLTEARGAPSQSSSIICFHSRGKWLSDSHSASHRRNELFIHHLLLSLFYVSVNNSINNKRWCEHIWGNQKILKVQLFMSL